MKLKRMHEIAKLKALNESMFKDAIIKLVLDQNEKLEIVQNLTDSLIEENHKLNKKLKTVYSQNIKQRISNRIVNEQTNEQTNDNNTNKKRNHNTIAFTG